MNQNRRARPLITFTTVPFYLVDFIGMVLLGWGVVRCRPNTRPGHLSILAAARPRRKVISMWYSHMTRHGGPCTIPITACD